MDHGLALAAALDYTPLYVRYNTGLHTSQNGRELAAQLEQLVMHWPVPVKEITIIAHSMGGLVTRSAGITDLRYGHVIDEDWIGHDRFRRSPDRRVPVPLPAAVACYTVAATMAALLRTAPLPNAVKRT